MSAASREAQGSEVRLLEHQIKPKHPVESQSGLC
jgi:hypothetical protein